MIEKATLNKLNITSQRPHEEKEIFAKSKDIEGKVVIPGTYKGVPISVASGREEDLYYSEKITSFAHCEKITEIIMQEGPTYLETKAFEGCISLQRVVIPPSVVSIGWRAFADCTALKEIVIPDSVEYIEEEAFYGCTSLEKVVLPATITVIGRHAFRHTKIYNDACENDLVYVDNWLVDFKGKLLPHSLAIKEGTVGICEQVCGIEVQAGLAYWQTKLTEEDLNNSNLQKVIFPSTLIHINEGAFANCKALAEIVLPDSVKNIEKNAFINCKSLKTIKLPKNLESVGVYAFSGTALMEQAGDNMVILDNCLICGSKNGKEAIVPEHISVIAGGAFENNTLLEKIVIPSTVTRIDDRTFYDCKNLKTVEFKGDLKYVGYAAFRGTSIQHIDLSKCEVVGRYSFHACPLLKKVHINGTVYGSAFCRCASLEEVVIGQKVKNIPRDMLSSSAIKRLVVPSSVRTIEEYAFIHCSQLENVVMEEGVEHIKKEAFKNCSKLSKLVLPKSIISVGVDAFRGVRLTQAVIPDQVANMKATGLMLRKDLSAYDISQLTVCFTGKLRQFKRADAEQAVLKAGGQIAKSVNKNVSLVVYGSDAGEKLERADELMIDIVDEMEFLTILGMMNMKEKDDGTSPVFEMTKHFYYQLKDVIAQLGLTAKHQNLVEEFIKVNATPCYYFEEIQGEPTALDSHFAGTPYCPMGEDLPKNQNGEVIPLLFQLNLHAINLAGYPSKGILQVFGGHPNDDSLDLDTEGLTVRYYPELSDDYRRDVKATSNIYAKTKKIKLVRGWSVFNLMYSDHQDEFEASRPTEAAILNKMRTQEGVCVQSCAEALNQLFPRKSNIGGYAGATPQGNWSFPQDALVFLSEDTIDWGDSGCIIVNYKDLTKVKKDEQLDVYGDMC